MFSDDPFASNSNGNEIDNLSNGNNNNNSNSLNSNVNATNADNANNGADIQDADNRLHCRDKQQQQGMGEHKSHSLDICNVLHKSHQLTPTYNNSYITLN